MSSFFDIPRQPGEEQKSVAEIFASLPPAIQDTFLKSLTEEQAADLKYDADFWLRPKQLIDREKDWYITAFVGGRGAGKTRMGAEWVRKKARENPGCRIALAGRTVADVRTSLC